jgi:subtilisin
LEENQVSVKRKYLLLFVVLIVIACLGLTSFRVQAFLGMRGPLPLPQGVQQEKLAVFDALFDQTQQEGRVRLILELNVSFKPEGELFSGLSRRVQRYLISKAQNRVSDRLKAFRARIVRDFEFVPYMLVEVDANGLADLASNPDVFRMQQDRPQPPTLQVSVPLIGATAAWGEGYTGSGQAIVILDTGVQGSHDFLSDKVVAEACFSTTAGGADPSTTLCPDDSEEQIGTGAGVNCPLGTYGCEHGTHVAGIAAGNGASFSGVAKDADIIAVQIFSEFSDPTCSTFGMTSPCVLTWTSDQIAALNWVYSIQSSYNIAAVNMSLGGGQYTSNCDSDPRKASIDNLRSVGIATVIASGNSSFREAIGAPACISSAVSVGGTTDSDTMYTYSNVSSFLSLLAPGSWIYSSIPDNTYAEMSGTSMAAPHVAGAWALIRSKAPGASVDEILNALQTTGVLIDDNRSGGVVTDMPRIQVDSALALFEEATETPTATDTSTATATHTPTSTSTSTATPTSTETLTSTATGTATATYTSSPTSTNSSTPTPTATATPTNTATPTAIFEDVPYGHWAFDYINALYNAGYVAGCSSEPLLYCPDNILNRAQSAVFVLRGQYGAIPDPPYTPPATPTFADVDPSYWGYGWIESLWTDSFTAGCGTDPLIFCPLREHTRAEGSVFFLRIMHGVEYEPPPASGIFTDVDLGAWYADWVEAAYNDGILPACNTSPLQFCPMDPLSRDWAAYMMVQAKGGLPLTASVPEAAAASPTFSFAIASDMRSFAGAGIYDTPSYFRGAAEKVAEIGRTSFMISPGDLDHPSYPAWTIENYIGDDYKWYPVVGNHDIAWETLSWLMAYDYGSVNPGPSACPQTTYSFDYANAHFVVLNVYCNRFGVRSTDGDISDHLYDWLTADLEATDQEHIFVFGHEPAFPQADPETGIERHVGDSLDAYPDRRDRFWQLLDDYGVVFYGCGHTHAFNVIQVDDVWQVDAGHASGLGYEGIPSTFIIVTVEGQHVYYDAYRDDGHGGVYQHDQYAVLR